VELEEARRTLGVAPGATVEAVRAAFRRLVLERHPDHAGATGTGETARLIEAYRVLRGAPRPAPRPPVPSAPVVPEPVDRRGTAGVRVEGDTVFVDRPASEVWALLREAADGLGEIAYVDRSAALLEIVVEFVDWPVSSVVCSLQGRATGTEIWCTVAALGTGEPPPAAGVARLVAERLATLHP
jgi:hypothetical protein